MIPFCIGFFAFIGAFFCSRYNLGVEILALRQQLGVFKRKNPRPRLTIKDRVFWILLRRLWPAWTHALVISGFANSLCLGQQCGKAEAAIGQRRIVLNSPFEMHPERFVRGLLVPAPLPEAAWINKPKIESNKILLAETTAIPGVVGDGLVGDRRS
jgi:hypothetical protein